MSETTIDGVRMTFPDGVPHSPGRGDPVGYHEYGDTGWLPAITRALADVKYVDLGHKDWPVLPSPEFGAIHLNRGCRIVGDGTAALICAPTPYLTSGRDRYALINGQGTDQVELRGFEIVYNPSTEYKNITLDGVQITGEHCRAEEVAIVHPRAGATKECWGVVLKGPGNYPEPTNLIRGCRFDWPQGNSIDERPAAYLPELTPWYVGGGTIEDCAVWISIDEDQTSPCQGASGRGRNLVIRRNRVYVLGDTRRAKASWIQNGDVTGNRAVVGLPDPDIYDNRVIPIYTKPGS